jgi:hypothetical protein
MSIEIDYTNGTLESTFVETLGAITGNATLDLTSGNVFSHTPTANTTFTFSNPPASGTGYSFTLKLTGANVTSGWDVPNLTTFSSTNQFDNTGPSNLEEDVFIRDNGTDLFILDYYGTIWHYSLATPFDVDSTATLVRSLVVNGTTGTGVSGSGTDFRGFTFSPDGTQVIVRCDDSTLRLSQFSLANAWDLSSTKTHVSTWTTIASTGGISDSRSVRFANNGTLLTLGGNNVDTRFGIVPLSTPYDLSSVGTPTVYNLTAFGYTARSNYWVHGSNYSADGTKLIISSVYGYEKIYLVLATPFDPSSYTSMNTYTGGTSSASLSWTSDGAKVVSVKNSTSFDINVYSTAGSAAAATFTYPSSVKWHDGQVPASPASGDSDVLSFSTTNGGTTWYGYEIGGTFS